LSRRGSRGYEEEEEVGNKETKLVRENFVCWRKRRRRRSS
jgi:hypothetical protein